MAKTKSRSKFTFEIFTGGADGDEFVVHSEKYSKEEAIKLLKEECYTGYINYREPKIEDISERFVRWFPRIPDWCGYEAESGGCYTYCSDGERGSFKAYVIKLKELMN